MRYFIGVVLCSFTFAAFGAGVVSACDYSGSDAGAKITNALADLPSTGGTVDARCQTGSSLAISSTVTISKPATVILGVGTYTGSVGSSGPVFSLTSAGASLVGTSPQATIVTTSTGGNGVDTGDDTTIKNLTLRGTNGSVTSTYATGINSGDADNVRVENVVVEQWANMGLNTGGSPTRWMITNSTFRDNKNDGVFIASGGSGNIVSNCTFRDNAAIGIDTNSDLTTISNNYLYNNGYGGYASGDNFGIFIGGASNCTVTGNTVERTHGQGIIVKCAGSECTANYNTITGNSVKGGCSSTCSTQDGIALDGSSSGTLKGNYIGSNTLTGLVRSGIEVDGGVATVQENRILGNQAFNNATGIECGGNNAVDNTVALNTMLGNTTAESYPSGTRTQHYMNKITTSNATVDLGNAEFQSPMKITSSGGTELHVLSTGGSYGNFKFYVDSAGNLHLYDLNRSGEVFSMSANDTIQTNVLFNRAVGVSGTTARIYSGSGNPGFAANLGSIYLKTGGGTGSTFWVKETDDGGTTGWVAK